MRDAAMFVLVSTSLTDILYFPLRKISVNVLPWLISFQHTDFTTGLFAIVTVWKLNGPSPFEAFWAATSTALGPKDALVGLNRS